MLNSKFILNLFVKVFIVIVLILEFGCVFKDNDEAKRHKRVMEIINKQAQNNKYAKKEFLGKSFKYILEQTKFKYNELAEISSGSLSLKGPNCTGVLFTDKSLEKQRMLLLYSDHKYYYDDFELEKVKLSNVICVSIEYLDYNNSDYELVGYNVYIKLRQEIKDKELYCGFLVP